MNSGKSGRYFFEVSYLGTAYHGWQKQKNAHTVQEEIDAACQKLWPGCDSIVGSGRTDTGVHCSQQFFHLDVPLIRDPERTVFRLNRMLPKDIAIGSIRRVGDDAHARFSAIQRTYHYLISRRKDVFAAGLTYHFERELDVEAMNRACERMITFGDFQAFSKVNTDVNHFRCSIESAGWEEAGNELRFTITANRFLRGMVRAIVGTLLLIGRGKARPESMDEIIMSRDRRNAGAAAPPEGLYLASVVYPESIFIETH